MALVAVILAAGFTTHCSGISFHTWKWTQLGGEEPLLWIPVPLFQPISRLQINSTVQACSHMPDVRLNEAAVPCVVLVTSQSQVQQTCCQELPTLLTSYMFPL